MSHIHTIRRLTTTAATLVALSLIPSHLASAGPEKPTDLRHTLQQGADDLLPQGAPGVLVHLKKGQRDIAVRSGVGNTDTGAPVPWKAKFRIGSLTKTFVATTVLQLVGEKRLSLDDTVEQWLPGVVEGNGNDGSAITVRQLLQHTSGIPEYVSEIDWVSDQAGFEKHRFDTVTPQEAVGLAMQNEPSFAPGTDWSYSNTNYALAGMIIEEATGNTWQSEVRQRIVKPLGLHDTTLPGTRSDVPRPHAIGYERFPGPDATPEDPQWGAPIDATQQNPSWGGAAGEIISTTDDTNRFLRAVARGSLLKPAQVKEMKTTVPVTDGFDQNWPGARYGLGILWIPNSCGGHWGHGGDIMGYMTRNGVTPDGKRSVMVSLNTDSPVAEPGVPAPTQDMTNQVIDDALCG